MALGFGSGFSDFDYGDYASGFGADEPKNKKLDFTKLLEDPAFLFGISLLGNSHNPNAMAQATTALIQMQGTQQAKTRGQHQREYELATLENEKAKAAQAQAKAIRDAERDEEKMGFDREKFGFDREKHNLEKRKAEAELAADQRKQEQQAAFFEVLKNSGVFGGGGAPPPTMQPQSGTGKYGTPTRLLDNLFQTESSGNPRAVNPESGAMGGYQFMPQTIAMLRNQGHTFDPFNAEQSRDTADMYIQQLLQQHGGDYSKAMAAYGGFKTKDPTPYLRKVLDGVGSGGAQPPAGLDIARLGALAGVSGIPGATGLIELGKLSQEKNVPAGSYTVDPATGARAFNADPYKEDEARFKRGSSPIEGLTPEDRSALVRVNLEKQADHLTKNYFEKLQGVPEQFVAVQNARKLAPGAVPFTGSLGEQKLAAFKFLNHTFGRWGVNIQPEAVADAELLKSQLFVPIFNSLKLLDAQPTEQQQKLMMQSFGQLGNDPKALVKMIDAIEERLATRVKLHNRMYEEAKKAGAPIIYDLRIELPETSTGDNPVGATSSPAVAPQNPTPNAAQPMSLDQYLQKYRKKK